MVNMKLRNRTFIAFIKDESEIENIKDEDYVNFDELPKERQDYIRKKLQIQFLEAMGAKNIKRIGE